MGAIYLIIGVQPSGQLCAGCTPLRRNVFQAKIFTLNECYKICMELTVSNVCLSNK